MELTRKHGWLLLAIAAWNVVIWLTFAKNLHAAYADGEDRATGYWVAHSVLIVVDLVIAFVLTRLGVRLLRSRRPGAPLTEGGAGATPERGSGSAVSGLGPK